MLDISETDADNICIDLPSYNNYSEGYNTLYKLVDLYF